MISLVTARQHPIECYLQTHAQTIGSWQMGSWNRGDRKKGSPGTIPSLNPSLP